MNSKKISEDQALIFNLYPPENILSCKQPFNVIKSKAPCFILILRPAERTACCMLLQQPVAIAPENDLDALPALPAYHVCHFVMSIVVLAVHVFQEPPYAHPHIKGSWT